MDNINAFEQKRRPVQLLPANTEKKQSIAFYTYRKLPFHNE